MKKSSSDDITNFESQYNIAHFKKVNLFGSSKVGKKTLISYIQHFSNNEIDFEIKNDDSEENIDNKENLNLVENVKKISIKYYDTRRLDINLYITKTDNKDLISENLDTILLNSECVIFMIDITSTNSFKEVSELMPLVYEKMKANLQYGEVPIFFLSNKVDLEINREVSGYEVKELIDHYQGIINYEISLKLEKNQSDDTINEFIIKLCNTISDQEKKYTFKYDSLNLVKICEPMKLNKESKIIKNVSNSLNLLLLGSQSVGKTSFAAKLFQNLFKEETITTLGVDIESTVTSLYGSLVKIELWDTVGQERLRSIPKKHFSKGDGFFLLFDVTDRKSFEDVEGWIKDIRTERGNGNEDVEKKTTDEVLVLVGNKIDKIGQRKVTKEEATQLAYKYDIKYYETSCRQGINLYEILCDIIFQASSNNRRESTRVIMLERENQAKMLIIKKGNVVNRYILSFLSMVKEIIDIFILFSNLAFIKI